MPTLHTDWATAINDGDDTAILVYCDRLDESDESREHELSAILRQWVNDKTIIRTIEPGDWSKVSEFDKLVFDWNKNYAPDAPASQFEDGRYCYVMGRLGEAYTTMHVTPEYMTKRPNILSAQPIRHLVLRSSRAERSQLFDTFSNWRLEKLWHLEIQHYSWFMNESNLVDVIKMMKPMTSLKSITFRGIRDTNFKVSSTLIASKKLCKGCKIQVGNNRYTV